MAKNNYDMNTILGENSNYEGDMKIEGSMRVEGNFKGEITASSVVVGKNAKLEANINADSVIVGGEVNGNINTSKELTLQKTGKIIGDVETPTLVVEDGAILQGNCKMK